MRTLKQNKCFYALMFSWSPAKTSFAINFSHRFFSSPNQSSIMAPVRIWRRSNCLEIEAIYWVWQAFLIGGGTPFGFHLGPAFYYLSAIPLWFFRLDPVGWGVTAAVFGAVTVWLMWLVGKTLFSPRIGLMAALLWATSFTAVMADRHWWPLVLDPMLSLIVIVSLFRILQDAIRPNPNRRIASFHWWIILGFTLAFAWQADLTVLPLFWRQELWRY